MSMPRSNKTARCCRSSRSTAPWTPSCARDARADPSVAPLRPSQRAGAAAGRGDAGRHRGSSGPVRSARTGHDGPPRSGSPLRAPAVGRPVDPPSHQPRWQRRWSSTAVTPPDVVESGVRVGRMTYPGYPAAAAGVTGADDTVRVAFFALLFDQSSPRHSSSTPSTKQATKGRQSSIIRFFRSRSGGHRSS